MLRHQLKTVISGFLLAIFCLSSMAANRTSNSVQIDENDENEVPESICELIQKKQQTKENIDDILLSELSHPADQIFFNTILSSDIDKVCGILEYTLMDDQYEHFFKKLCGSNYTLPCDTAWSLEYLVNKVLTCHLEEGTTWQAFINILESLKYNVGYVKHDIREYITRKYVL